MRIIEGMRDQVKRYGGLFFILPAFILSVILFIYPIIKVIQISFFQGVFIEALPRFVGLQNYFRVGQDKVFLLALRNTCVFTFVSVFAHLVIGLGLGILLSQKINLTFRAFFRAIFVSPWTFPTAIVATTWLLIYHPFGVFNGLLDYVGLVKIQAPIEWLSSKSLALWSLIIVNVWRGFPLYFLMLLASLQAIPPQLYEAASIDGANSVNKFFHITLPALKGTIMTLILLDSIWTFRHFDLVSIMTGGGPGYSSQLMATYSYENAFQKLDFGYASVLAMIILGFSLIVSFKYLRTSRIADRS